MRVKLKWLTKMAAAQFSTENPQQMQNFNIDLFLRDRGEHPREFGFFLHYSRSPKEVFELAIDDVENNTQVRKGFDGKNYWLEASGKKRQTLTGHEFTEDRQAIEDGIELCGDLMLILDLRQFAEKNPPSILKTKQDGTRILEGQLLRKGKQYTYRVHLDADSLLPSKVDFILFDDEQQITKFQSFATLAYKKYSARQIPQVIYEFDTADNGALPQRIYEIHDMAWGPKPQAISDDKKPSQGQRN